MSFALARYRSTRTVTASPLQIVVQLYDGAIRYLRSSQEAMTQRDYPAKGHAVRKAHAIVSELQATLDPAKAPELCAQLYGLYDFVLTQLAKANVENAPEHLDSAIRVLSELRDGWAQIAKEQA
ncbi:MAG: flagellar export chaperone FliS [Myxococcales bacterium]|nr:flagellar export chaperone FliS [Myxococcales bacterium]